MSLPLRKARQLKILDFDIENRPLSYWFGDVTTSEITAIAWSWVGQKTVYVKLLGRDSAEEMLGYFTQAYDEADMVTGHYIRRHDLPIINGALTELGLGTLGEKLTSDTKLDLAKRWGLPATQEYLAAALGVEAPKIGMSQPDWRDANRLTPDGIKLTKERVVGDVIQHKALRVRLHEEGLLKEPKVWRP